MHIISSTDSSEDGDGPRTSPKASRLDVGAASREAAMDALTKSGQRLKENSPPNVTLPPRPPFLPPFGPHTGQHHPFPPGSGFPHLPLLPHHGPSPHGLMDPMAAAAMFPNLNSFYSAGGSPAAAMELLRQQSQLANIRAAFPALSPYGHLSPWLQMTAAGASTVGAPPPAAPTSTSSQEAVSSTTKDDSPTSSSAPSAGAPAAEKTDTEDTVNVEEVDDAKRPSKTVFTDVKPSPTKMSSALDIRNLIGKAADD